MDKRLIRGGAFLLMCLLALCSYTGYGQDMKPDSMRQGKIHYGSKGFEFQTRDKNFLLQIQSRFQFRFATPNDQDPITFDDYYDEATNVFKINRARLKVGGHAYRPWLKYYWEYELGSSNLLDFRIMIEKWDWLKLKVGQWKVEYSQERRISSGEQQLVDRSIVNRPFTLDRQQGVELYGHIKGKGLLDFNYWTAILTGTGRGNTQNDDNNLMYFGRVQWNVLGGGLGFEGSDLDITEKPKAFISLSGVTNRSPYTRFSSAGGGELLGYEDGAAGQYRTNQYNLETALKYKGFSWQSEFHRKRIIDKLNNDESTLLQGFYLQGGYLFHQTFSWWPEPLELALRYANYNPDIDSVDTVFKQEETLAVNWFFKGHKNKLTMEISRFDFLLAENEVVDEWRFRIQWDISL